MCFTQNNAVIKDRQDQVKEAVQNVQTRLDKALRLRFKPDNKRRNSPPNGTHKDRFEVNKKSQNGGEKSSQRTRGGKGFEL